MWKVSVSSDLRGKIGVITTEKLNLVKRVLAVTTREVASWIKSEYLTGGTTDTKLAVRTGRLRASCRPAPVEIVGTDRVEGGLLIGTVYGRVHIGRKGSSTTITPKKARMLAIPLDAAKTAAGVARGTPRGGPWGQTFIARVKGNLIIFGKRQITKGPRAGQFRGGIVPLFLLKKQVKIKTRVPLEDIEAELLKRVIESLKGVKAAVTTT